MDWKLTLLLILGVLTPAVVIIAILMEVYKKAIRKDKANVWEIRSVATALTLILTYSGVKGFDLPGHGPSIVYYFFGVYALQFVIDMKVVKAVAKALIKHLAKKKGIENPWEEN